VDSLLNLHREYIKEIFKKRILVEIQKVFQKKKYEETLPFIPSEMKVFYLEGSHQIYFKSEFPNLELNFPLMSDIGMDLYIDKKEIKIPREARLEVLKQAKRELELIKELIKLEEVINAESAS
jgi:hypothetical protein